MLVVAPTATTWPTGRTVKQVIRSGAVIYCNTGVNSARPRFSQLVMAAVGNDGVSVYVTFIGRPPAWADNAQVYVLPDTVGLAEQIVTLEGPNAFVQ